MDTSNSGSETSRLIGRAKFKAEPLIFYQPEETRPVVAAIKIAKPKPRRRFAALRAQLLLGISALAGFGLITAIAITNLPDRQAWQPDRSTQQTMPVASGSNGPSAETSFAAQDDTASQEDSSRSLANANQDELRLYGETYYAMATDEAVQQFPNSGTATEMTSLEAMEDENRKEQVAEAQREPESPKPVQTVEAAPSQEAAQFSAMVTENARLREEVAALTATLKRLAADIERLREESEAARIASRSSNDQRVSTYYQTNGLQPSSGVIPPPPRTPSTPVSAPGQRGPAPVPNAVACNATVRSNCVITVNRAAAEKGIVLDDISLWASIPLETLMRINPSAFGRVLREGERVMLP